MYGNIKLDAMDIKAQSHTTMDTPVLLAGFFISILSDPVICLSCSIVAVVNRRLPHRLRSAPISMISNGDSTADNINRPSTMESQPTAKALHSELALYQFLLCHN